MSVKRSRATYEADLAAQQSPYVVFGTALPPLDPEVRDDGSYVPVWKQEVRDERGRKRLHGAFTGGFSAGYFNTVGSKEGWTPSTFVSSRTNRRKDAPNAEQQRPEDFMDEEDLAELEESRKIQTNAAFAGLGSTEDAASQVSGLMGLFRVEGETMGAKLLKKMGWREGQGVGPKVRRSARLELQGSAAEKADMFLFAPDNVPMISLTRKTDHRGLGYGGQSRLASIGQSTRSGSAANSNDEDDDENMGGFGRPSFSLALGRKKEKDTKKGGIGIGILNDTGSDDEDPYEIGPRISYNKVIGGDRKKKKASIAINPSLKTKPVFRSKKSVLAKVALGVRKCHDGRLPLDGFVFGKEADSLISEVNSQGKYPPPRIPPDWKSSKIPKSQTDSKEYVSTADAAKASTLNPKARAALLGEKELPGKSVFDFMSAAARERLVAATGKVDLPAARGEIPAGYALTEAERLRELHKQVPMLGKDTAIAALSRGAGGGAPYGDDEDKRARYRAYLEYQAGFKPALPPKPAQTSTEDWLREINEFFNCARIFKPMTGLMASRFTTSSSTLNSTTSTRGETGERDLVTKPPPKREDPAEEAARLGMFGSMTRTVADFHPTRLLCKRFNVKPPANVQTEENTGRARTSAPAPFDVHEESSSTAPRDLLALEFGVGASASDGSTKDVQSSGGSINPAVQLAEKPSIDSSKNEALEATRAGDDVFKAIFGDSDDDDE
ncbi:hypothetical protein B0T22DRAFT_14985 [Podospora appendiculata]|uniref:G-patch domain-containing protein n=1 Tax=Podospora appendiculata TaxID=314037 RepID=A0AAE0XFS6_9PEZI|nr:hypothetical protein B0T22DRAFT_14985 [Podospora appendiculata]